MIIKSFFESSENGRSVKYGTAINLGALGNVQIKGTR